VTTGDASHMRRAIELARKQHGRTADNPAVGCVIVKDGRIISEAATADGGRPHAEEQALDHAGAGAAGVEAFVTLEPCGERSGGGASCAERLAAAGVRRVIYACDNPHPLSAGLGPARLRRFGVIVEAGLLAKDAAFLVM
jgi:diaminohydroxyphosphoribosylaminopyrimidine deaminase / 5-amino-6-(5-phosphoribosylamino)uracil reductase